MKKVKNFARFFSLLKQIPYADADLKEEYVETFTGGRTTSLREMTTGEYNTMCQALEAKIGDNDFTAEIRRQRSAVLKRISRLGIDTGNWNAVDNFCLNPRIAGKLFRQLNIDELRGLIPKLEAIIRKDTSRSKRESPADFTKYKALELYLHDIDGLIRRAANQLPS